MITCTLGDKKYTIDFISGRALREMEPAAKMYAKIVNITNAAVRGESVPEAEQISIPEAMDVMVKWFCLAFGNQFTVDEVLDKYPVDRLMHDMALTLMAVQAQTTSIHGAAIQSFGLNRRGRPWKGRLEIPFGDFNLSEFPTKAAQTETPTQTTET